MDYSDSDECFESADEDFDSDCSEKRTSSLQPKQHSQGNILDNKTFSPTNSLIDSHIEDEVNENKVGDTKSNVEYDISIKSTAIPPRPICQFPKENLTCSDNVDSLECNTIDDEKNVVDVTTLESNATVKIVKENKLIIEKADKIVDQSDKNIAESFNTSSDTKSEHRIPPVRTVCWFPEVNLPGDTTITTNEGDHVEDKLLDQNNDSAGAKSEELTQKVKCKINVGENGDDSRGNDNDEACKSKNKVVMSNMEDIKKQVEVLSLQDENDRVKTSEKIASTNDSKQTIENHPVIDDDLWGDDEGWGCNDDDINENLEPANSTKTIIAKSEIKEASVNDNDDNLWNDDENWGDNVNEKENLGEDKTANIHNTLENLSSQSDNSWGGWGTWGISSVLSTAANITSSVSQGLSNVLETGIGVPDPAELARQHKLEEKLYKQEGDCETHQEENSSNNSAFGLGNLVSGVSTITKIVESTGTKVISGGLDTLETIGKKTMEVLSENDPGLKKKRAFLKIDQNKPVLSHILREAKERAEEENKQCEKRLVKKKANYETIFDDYQGLVHLEALEMLSRQCDIKLHLVLSKSNAEALNELQETMDLVKELCELPEDDEENVDLDDLENKLKSSICDLGFALNFSKILECWSILDGLDFEDPEKIHDSAIENLAQLTAFSVEQFHKAGELLLVKEHRSTANEADSLVQLTGLFSSMISSTANKFTDNLNQISTTDKKEINALITNIFFEAANSGRYIVDAFQLLIPVIQVGAAG